MMKTISVCLAIVATCMIFGFERSSAAQDTPPSYADWKSDFLDVSGIRIHYWRTGGTGKPVMVLAHGITDFGLNWAALAEKFVQEYDLIMYDARGHGYSDKPEGPYDLESHVNDLIGLLHTLGIEKPILMGHSMGGSIVALTAATVPDLPRAVILEDPADLLVLFQPLPEEVIPRWKAQVRADREMGKEKLIKSARTERHPGWRDADYSLWADSKLLVHPNVVDILKGSGFGNARETYAKIKVPVLILKADADPAGREKHLEVARALLRGKLVHVDKAGHVVRNDRPVEVEREIRTFLDELK